MQKNERNLKVYNQSGYHYKPTSTIQLKGQWLEQYGFAAGTPVKVSCKDGELSITICTRSDLKS